MDKKNWKKILDWIKKDLVRVTSFDSEFNMTCKEKAREILDNWKDWITSYDDFINSDDTHAPLVNMNMRVNTIKQLNSLAGASTQNIDSRRTTSGKRYRNREETEKAPTQLKKKTLSSGSSTEGPDIRNYFFSQIRTEQNEQDQRPRTPNMKFIHQVHLAFPCRLGTESDNDESQEPCDLDIDPISDHKLPDELCEEMKGLNASELLIRNKLLEILHQNQFKDLKSGKTLMSSNFLNGIIDVSDANFKTMIKSELNKLNEGQQWFDKVLSKQTWILTPEFTNYRNQFTDDVCNRMQLPTLVRKSFVTERFDPFVHEGHDIAQDIMKHFSVRLEAPCNIYSKASKLERTYAIDTIIYVMNRIFRMHFDVLDGNWIEILTSDTKSHKIDGVLNVFQTKKFRQTIIIIEFSHSQYASADKETDDQVKLSRNAKRILNKLLDRVSYEQARVYTIQSINGNINIKYMVRPLPSIYLYEEFVSIKIPTTFDDMEEFAKSMSTLMDFQTDVLQTVKLMNKKPIEGKK
ncbi:27258_t:CDS:2, partial [Dentiscutata erythropus]